MSGAAAVTIAAGNYVAFARVLARSLAEHHPEVPLHLLLADAPAALPERGREPFVVWDLAEVVPGWRELAFRLPLADLVAAVKPHALRHLLRRGHERVVYLDSDILVLDRLTPVLEPPGEAAIALVPHLLAPPEGSDRIGRELGILRAGTFNAGCLGVARGAAAEAFLDWWAERLRESCRIDAGAGLHRDQRWLDLAPGLFGDVAVVRDPRIGVAYWNLEERRGTAPRFVHFSGFDPGVPTAVSRHVPGRTVAAAGGAGALFLDYARRLAAAGVGDTFERPVAFDRFANGVAVPLPARWAHADLGAGAAAHGDPFRTEAGSFYEWLRTPPAERALPPLWRAVYARRPDLWRAFPDVDGRDRPAFAAWTAAHGRAEHDVPPELAGCPPG